MSDYQTSLLDLQRNHTNMNANYASNGNLLESCASVTSFASYRSVTSLTNGAIGPVKATKDAVNGFEQLKRKLKIK